MSTNLFEGPGIQVTRFACGKCKTDGPCFQITGDGGSNGDYVVVHRSEAQGVSKAMLDDLGLVIVDVDDQELRD